MIRDLYDTIVEFFVMLRDAEYRELDWETLRGLWPTITEITLNPASNPVAALFIYLIITMLVVLIGMSVILFILRAGEEDEYEEDREYVTDEGAQETVHVVVTTTKDPLRVHKWILGTAVVVNLTIAVAGFTTQSPSVCTGCHTGSPHFETLNSDPHQQVTCVACHEGATFVGGLSMAVPARVVHVVTGMAEGRAVVRPPSITGRGCRRCHTGVGDAVIEIPDRGLLMSHKEPLESGAGCLDCHILDGDEKISQVTTGMEPCLRCHDGTDTSAECSVCHTGSVTQAVLATRPTSEKDGRVLVPRPGCYSCHETVSCDACHGVRLPHPADYALRGHMRDAAEDLWSTRGATCYRCHVDDTERSCYRAGCHADAVDRMPSHSPDGSFRFTHQREPVLACEGCHNTLGLFDNTCQMCHEAVR